MEVPAESVVLDEELSGGLIMEVGETRDVALKVKVLPENATDLAELFYSSNVEVATVSPKGVITAQKAGITMISIYVSGIETYFAVTVVDQIPIDIESIVFSAPAMNAYAGVGYNLLVSVEPFDQNEGVVFSSSDPEIASVNAETGRMICHRSGSVTITAAARNHPEVKASIEVTVTEFYGDWDRNKWSMSFSHGWKADSAIGSSATAAIDGNASTTLSMDRPGRNGLSADDVIWFQIDRGENPGKVNYLRIHHRPEGGGNQEHSGPLVRLQPHRGQQRRHELRGHRRTGRADSRSERLREPANGQRSDPGERLPLSAVQRLERCQAGVSESGLLLRPRSGIRRHQPGQYHPDQRNLSRTRTGIGRRVA